MDSHGFTQISDSELSNLFPELAPILSGLFVFGQRGRRGVVYCRVTRILEEDSRTDAMKATAEGEEMPFF